MPNSRNAQVLFLQKKRPRKIRAESELYLYTTNKNYLHFTVLGHESSGQFFALSQLAPVLQAFALSQFFAVLQHFAHCGVLWSHLQNFPLQESHWVQPQVSVALISTISMTPTAPSSAVGVCWDAAAVPAFCGAFCWALSCANKQVAANIAASVINFFILLFLFFDFVLQLYRHNFAKLNILCKIGRFFANLAKLRAQKNAEIFSAQIKALFAKFLIFFFCL